MRRTRTRKLALRLALLALGGLGLVACGGGDDDQVTAAPATPTKRAELYADKTACGHLGRYKFAVVYGDVSCRVARDVVDGSIHQRAPGSWTCGGSDSRWSCVNNAGEAITAHARKKVLRRWRAAERRIARTDDVSSEGGAG